MNAKQCFWDNTHYNCKTKSKQRMAIWLKTIKFLSNQTELQSMHVDKTALKAEWKFLWTIHLFM